MEALTVNELFEACKAQIKKGNGNKHIMISDDDEGNGYHDLFFLFTPTKDFGDFEYMNTPFRSLDELKKNYVVLG